MIRSTICCRLSGARGVALVIGRAPIFAALAVSLVLASGCRQSNDSGRVLEVEISTSSGHFAQLFWHFGSEFTEENSLRVPLSAAAGAFQRVRFPLPRGVFHGLRLDPIDTAGEVRLQGLRLLSASGEDLADLDPGSLAPSVDIASVTRHGATIDIITTRDGTDPILSIPPDAVNFATTKGSLMVVTPASLSVVSTIVFVLFIAAIASIYRSPARLPIFPDDAGAFPAAGLGAASLAALFLIIVGAKLMLIARYPTPVPYLDQWEGEARIVYLPYHDGYLSWLQMASLHNEHRVFFTRLLSLLTLLANGQWDPRLQQVLNAILHAMTGCLTAAILWFAGARRRPILLLTVVGLVFGLPFGWENTLAGFQSAFYFLLLLSVLALWLTDNAAPGSGPWILGWLCAFGALFSTAGGLFTTLAIVTMVMLKWIAEPARWREFGRTLGISAIVLAIGLAIASPPLAQHAPLKAASLHDFLQTLAANLAWPWIGRPALAVLMWLPIATLVLIAVVRPKRITSLDRICVGLAAWAAMQAVAIAYARGAGGMLPASRYMDLFSIGLLSNAVAAVNLAEQVMPKMPRRLAVTATAVWLSVAAVGLGRISDTQVHLGAEERRQWMAGYITNVRQFVVTDDLTTFLSRTFPFDVPWASPSVLANTWLRDEYIRSILPPSIREPLHLQSESAPDGSFRHGGYHPLTPNQARQTMGSYTELGNAAQGEFTARSTSACAPGSRLEFEVAGYLGFPGLSLAITDATGRAVAIQPPELPRERWLPVPVDCPREPFTVTAVDRNPAFWFAFTDPVEMTRGSYYAEYLIAHAESLLLVGLALLAFA